MGAEPPLSDGERAVIAAAEAEARKLHHGRLGTEHLLLGVLSRPDEPGARALAKLGVTLGPTRAQVMRIVGLGVFGLSTRRPVVPNGSSTQSIVAPRTLSKSHSGITIARSRWASFID